MPMNTIHTCIWQEEPEADNTYATHRARCHGFDVYGAMLGRARWAEMIYLLFCGEAASLRQAALLDVLAVALANPGPRDASVHAAMCGGIGGSPAAASLIAALAVGAGASSGAREVHDAMQVWARCADNPANWLTEWESAVQPPVDPVDDIWPPAGHPPGFDPHGTSIALTVRQTLAACASCDVGPRLDWLQAHHVALEAAAGLPLALSGVAAAAFADLGLDPQQGEMLFLLLRLPGAAVHALEQSGKHYRDFPFPALDLRNDPQQGVPS